MVIQMTKEEYEKQFGTSPSFSNPSSNSQKTPFVNKVANFFGAKGITEQFGADIARTRAKGEQEKNLVEYPSFKKVAGSAIETGANLIPIAKTGNLATKAIKGATTGAVFDTGNRLQNDKPLGIGAGAIAGGGIPVAGALIKPATKFIGTLLKGTGSGLSGAPSEALEEIFNNPKVALKTAKEIRANKGADVLRGNAKTIQEGLGKIKQEARKSFGEGLEQLSETDINPTVFRDNTQKVLDRFGSLLNKGKRELTGVEFSESKNLKKASELIDRLNTTKLDGKSLRKLADDIESSKYKIATSDERLSFNAFLNDLSSSLKDAVGQSTPKLDEINKAFSGDMQLVEATESILGKSQFRNLKEVLNTSKKLEGLFTQKGIAPEIVDQFLERIGVSADNFKTSEAMRQVADKSFQPNQIGANPFEVVRAFTSSVVSPKMVGQIAAQLGLANNVVKEMADKLSPATRNVIINLLLGNPTEEPNSQ